MKKTIINKIFTGLLVFAVAMCGLAHVPVNEVQAEGTSDPAVRYVTVDKTTFEKHIDAHTYPNYEGKEEDGNTGWFFAGWYADNHAISSKTDEDIQANSVITAKYVSSNYAGIICQIRTKEDTTTDLRVVSAVHGGNYQAVGFNLYKRIAKAEGGYQDKLICKYSEGNDNPAQSTKLYSGLQTYTSDNQKGEIRTPAQEFGITGQYADDFRFTAAVVRNIPTGYLDTAIIIKPYWITMDGTKVEGMGEIDRAQDFEDQIVNVSVNITNAEDIAAGRLNVGYETSMFEFQGYEYGRVFEEVEAAVKDGVVKCVGVVSDIENNSNAENDVYVNLRFKKTSANDLKAGAATFTVTVDQFCDNTEEIKSVSAWNVKY